jgi:hypothetical protein
MPVRNDGGSDNWDGIRKRRAPTLQHSLEPAFSHVRLRHISRNIRQAEAGQRRIESLLETVDDELAIVAPLTRGGFFKLPNYKPPNVGRRRLMQLWSVRFCGFFG